MRGVKGFQKNHKTFKGAEKGWFKKGHITWNKGKEGPRGEKANNWKGNKVRYEGIHSWLYKTFGKADRCENPKCKYPKNGFDGKLIMNPKRFNWSLRNEKKYQRKKENFWMLCASCHIKYDEIGKKGWITRRQNH